MDTEIAELLKNLENSANAVMRICPDCERKTELINQFNNATTIKELAETVRNMILFTTSLI